MSNKQAWLTVTADAATIKLSRPALLNGVKFDKITLRAPTVGDLRASQKLANSDSEYQEIVLFASLSDASPSDIERLSIKDYRRIQEGYFRLIREDDDTGIKNAGEATGA
jgi:hypothetical protein